MYIGASVQVVLIGDKPLVNLKQYIWQPWSSG